MVGSARDLAPSTRDPEWEHFEEHSFSVVRLATIISLSEVLFQTGSAGAGLAGSGVDLGADGNAASHSWP